MSTTLSAKPQAAPFTVQVFCLCAAWCSACREYEVVFQKAQIPFAAHADIAFAWLDIEDAAEVVEPVDIEDFPTLLIAQDGQAVFFGPLTPQPQTLARILNSFSTTPHPALKGEAQALLERLTAI